MKKISNKKLQSLVSGQSAKITRQAKNKEVEVKQPEQTPPTQAVNDDLLKVAEKTNDLSAQMLALVHDSAKQAQISNDRIEKLLEIVSTHMASQKLDQRSSCKIEVTERDEDGFTKSLTVTPIKERSH